MTDTGKRITCEDADALRSTGTFTESGLDILPMYDRVWEEGLEKKERM